MVILLGGVGVALFLVLAAIAGELVARLDRIDGAFDGLAGRPAASPGETVLMIGTRPGGADDVAWLAGEQSVESVMLIEIDAGGRHVEVASLPVLDAITSPRPARSVAAVETWTGRRVDHVVALDWHTFAVLAEDNCVEAPYRYGSDAEAQHEHLREVLKGTLRVELRRQPRDLHRLLRTVADGASVDDGWSVGELVRLLVRLRDLRSHDISFSLARRP